MHLAQYRHPRGVFIEDPVSKASIRDGEDDAYQAFLSKLHGHVNVKISPWNCLNECPSR